MIKTTQKIFNPREFKMPGNKAKKDHKESREKLQRSIEHKDEPSAVKTKIIAVNLDSDTQSPGGRVSQNTFQGGKMQN